MSMLPDRIAVLGLAKSGIASVKYLQDLGKDIFVSDTCSSEKLHFVLASNSITGVQFEAGGHSKKILDSDLIVLSPGISPDIPILKKARDKKIPIISEIELAYKECKAPIIAVTGSTGKSTVVSMLGAILTASGKENVVGGNIGIPLVSKAPFVSKQGIVVAEISSFQLETVDTFKPNVAVILNLYKNHLDRYKSEEEYISAKKNIIKNLSDGDCFVFNNSDEVLKGWALVLENSIYKVAYGSYSDYFDSVWAENGYINVKKGEETYRVADIRNMRVKGKHNVENACAVVASLLQFGINTDSIEKGLSDFKGLEHRLEFVRELNGISFYNDSKATTAESVAMAVGSFDGNVNLVLGGKDKGANFKEIEKIIVENTVSVWAIGEAAQRIAAEWKSVKNMNITDDLKSAVVGAYNSASVGDIVLLSPGCSSFDMFNSFEERGSVFKSIVMGLS